MTKQIDAANEAVLPPPSIPSTPPTPPTPPIASAPSPKETTTMTTATTVGSGERQCECGKQFKKTSNYKDHRIRCRTWLESNPQAAQQDRQLCGFCLSTTAPKTYEQFRKHLSYLAELRTTSGCDGQHSFKTPAEHRMWLEGIILMRKHGHQLSDMVDFNSVARFIRVSFCLLPFL